MKLDSNFQFVVVASVVKDEKVIKVLCEGWMDRESAEVGFWDRVLLAGQKYGHVVIELTDGEGNILQTVEVTT